MVNLAFLPRTGLRKAIGLIDCISVNEALWFVSVGSGVSGILTVYPALGFKIVGTVKEDKADTKIKRIGVGRDSSLSAPFPS